MDEPNNPKGRPNCLRAGSVADYLRSRFFLFGVAAVPPPLTSAAATTATQSTPARAATAAATAAATMALAYSRTLSMLALAAGNGVVGSGAGAVTWGVALGAAVVRSLD
jgi:hypothetical protein